MEFAISAAQWVLGKALAPVMDGMLEAWAASKNLGLNMEELKMELLYAQGMLDHAQGREIHSPALKELLHKLQQLAYDSDDMLDELDYFRIQDELEGTFEAADKDARGVIQDTTLHVTAVAAEQGRILHGQDSSNDHEQEQGEARQRQRAQPQEKLAGGVRRLAYNARHTIGKHFLCCTCSPSVQADGESGTMETTLPVPQQESIVDPPPIQAGGDSSTLDTITSAAPQRDLEDVVDDMLDELHYFRIQDELEGTFEAADMDARGGIQDTALHARAVVVEKGRRVIGQDSPGDQDQEQGEARQKQMAQLEEKPAGGVRRLAYNARHTIGKHFLSCTCSPSVQTDGDSGTVDTSNITPTAPQQEQVDVVDSQHCSPSKLEFLRVNMSSRMKAIVEELKPLCAKVSVILNLELLHSNRSIAQVIAAELRAAHLKKQGSQPILPDNNVKARPKTTSYESESIFCGRDNEIATIMKFITAGEHSSGKGQDQLTVVPIVGLGGMGKTTLAQHIYKETEGYFDVRIWACVSTDFSVPRLFNDILELIVKKKEEDILESKKKEDILESKSLDKFREESESNGTPEEKIEQILTSKRFLLVLDDMWDTVNNDGWDRLLAPFRKGQTKGNIVLVTTRSPSVAEIVKVKISDSTIELEGMDPVAFRKFFQSRVFGDDEKLKEDHKELVDGTGEKIMEKLKGSPLAAKTVGTLLRNNLDQSHWKRVLDSKEWELQTGVNDIVPALRLSYDFLPFHLQRCFAYCCLFPEDYMFTRQQLIHWWIGLDILQPGPQNKSIEEIGQVYLDDLVSHGFIIKKDDIRSTYYLGTRRKTRYSIHDLLHDLGLKVASRECLILNSSNVVPTEIWPSVRHLSIIIDTVEDGKIDDFIIGLKELLLERSRRSKINNLRTLMVFGELDETFTGFLVVLLENASGLRVVNLENMQSSMEFPILRHLRYLRLGCKYSQGIHLPSKLSRFYHLRILDLNKWYETRPHLPRDMSNLTKLIHLDAKNFEIHSDICNVGKLHLLQELKGFEVKKESTGFELKQLGQLKKIRKLGIYDLEKINTKEEAAEAKLIDKQWLQKLELEWSRPFNKHDVEGLVVEGLQPPRNLQRLRICYHGSHSCPTWLGSKQHSPKSLQLLSLYAVNWERLPSLGHMEMLSDVSLVNIPRLKELGPGYFGRTLKSLRLDDLKGPETLQVPGDHDQLLSSLEKLSVRKCPPLVSGYSLVSLFIKHSSTLRWLETDDVTGVLDEPVCSILSSSLTTLILYGNEQYVRRRPRSFTKQQEDALVLLTSLQYLKFSLFTGLECLPACLHRLGNLKTLEIFGSWCLRSLPKDGLPSSLQELKC